MGNTGSTELVEGDIHEAWSILPAIATATSQIRVGPLVAPTSVHHPALLANRAATIDHLSNGRMVLGLGAGWQINEHHAYGIDLEEPGPRVSRFEESIQIVRSLLDNERTTFAGDFYSFTNAPCDPKPVQDQLPILVGTSGPRMCRITAAHAQEWNTWGAPEMAAESLATFTRSCEAVDVDPASLHTSTQAMFILTDDQAKIDKIMAGDGAARTIAGSPAHMIDRIGEYAEMGFNRATLRRLRDLHQRSRAGIQLTHFGRDETRVLGSALLPDLRPRDPRGIRRSRRRPDRSRPRQDALATSRASQAFSYVILWG